MADFQVPTYTAPAAGGWRLVDYKPAVTLTAKAGADGTATATGPTIDPGFLWSIQRAVVSTRSASVTQCRLYDSTVGDGTLMSGTNTGNYDEAEYPNGMLLDQSRNLVAQWVGATPGAVCTIRLQVAVLGAS